jgi:hypothetical protein
MVPISEFDRAAHSLACPRREGSLAVRTAGPVKSHSRGRRRHVDLNGRATDGSRCWSLFLIQAYILGIPLWWGLGFDFMIPQIVALALLCLTPSAHRHFILPDYLLVSIILTLGISAYVNGFLLSQETMRFVGALYNLSLWVSGLIVLQQVRRILNRDDTHRRALLRSCFWAFMLMAAIAIGVFGLGYVVHRFALVVPSVFGMTLGHHVPPSAVIVEQSTRLVFTRPDWGLPGVPMPRVTVYGPYPAATAALAAVLGTLAILYLNSVKRAGALVVLTMEGLVLLTLAITLTRSILAGWVAGALTANLVFGTGYRRLAACGAIAAAMLFVAQANVAGIAEYRAYSSESRFKNYVRAFNETLLSNPVLGLGFKRREEGNHIAVGSHSTFVSSFTKGGTLTALLVIAYFVFVPAFRWIGACGAAEPDDPNRRLRSERRLLLNLQVAIWVWLCFEDIDAPATAAMLIFLAFAFIEAASRQARSRSSDPMRSTVLSAAHRATYPAVVANVRAEEKPRSGNMHKETEMQNAGCVGPLPSTSIDVGLYRPLVDIDPVFPSQAHGAPKGVPGLDADSTTQR